MELRSVLSCHWQLKYRLACVGRNRRFCIGCHGQVPSLLAFGFVFGICANKAEDDLNSMTWMRPNLSVPLVHSPCKAYRAFQFRQRVGAMLWKKTWVTGFQTAGPQLETFSWRPFCKLRLQGSYVFLIEIPCLDGTVSYTFKPICPGACIEKPQLQSPVEGRLQKQD